MSIMPDMFTGTEVVSADTATANRRQTRYLFFAMDVITPKIKYQQPWKAFGGIYLPRFKTFRGPKKMLYKCAITSMEPKLVPGSTNMIHPDKRKDYVKSYVLQTPGQEDATISSPTSLYKEFLPGDEIQYAITPEPPNGEGGVVEITALRGKTQKERNAAQLFYFPNWVKIQSGQGSLPETPQTMELYLRARKNEVRNTYEGIERFEFESIGDDMIRSCIEYVEWGKNYVKFCQDALEQARTRGSAYTFPELAEMVMDQLGLVRKDEMAASTVAVTREGNADTLAEQRRANDLKEQELAIARERLSMEKTRMGQVEPVVPVPTVPVQAEPVQTGSEPASKPGCADFTANGDPCKGPAAKEINGVSYCRHHPKA